MIRAWSASDSTSTTRRRSPLPPRPSRRRSVRPTRSCTTPGSPPWDASRTCRSRCGSRLFRTNLFGPVRLTKELLPSMRAAGRGRIVVVSSQGGIRGMPSISAYSASKGALERWAEALAEEVAPFGLGRHHPGVRNVQDGHPHRADPSLRRPERAVRRALRADRSHGPLHGAPGEPARTLRSRARQSARRARPVRPACGGTRRAPAAVRQSLLPVRPFIR